MADWSELELEARSSGGSKEHSYDRRRSIVASSWGRKKLLRVRAQVRGAHWLTTVSLRFHGPGLQANAYYPRRLHVDCLQIAYGGPESAKKSSSVNVPIAASIPSLPYSVSSLPARTVPFPAFAS
jgi:hypothetical protein